MNQEMVKAEKRFANHKARLDILDENVRVLNWRQPGTQAYAIRAVMDGYHVYITGDLGSAVICLTETATLKALSEFSAQSNPSLCFLSDSAGKDVYVRGFGLTKKANQYLDSLYERFEYTNACEMDERDFPALKKQLAASSDKAALLSKAQEERGALWDDALNGCTRFKDAALTFDLDDTGNKAKKVAELRKAAKIIFEEGKGEK